MKIKIMLYYHQLLQKLKQTFAFPTSRITLVSYFLTVATIVSFFEFTTFFPSYLKIDFSAIIILIVAEAVSLPYALLIATLVPWLRLIIIPVLSDGGIVGNISFMLASYTMLISYTLIKFLLNLFFLKLQQPLMIIMIDIFSVVLTILITTILMIFFNFSFLLRWYGMSATDICNQAFILRTTFMLFNIFKFSCIFIVFLPLKWRLSNIFRFFALF